MGVIKIMVAGSKDDVDAFWRYWGAVSEACDFERVSPRLEGEAAIIDFAKNCLELKKVR